LTGVHAKYRRINTAARIAAPSQSKPLRLTRAGRCRSVRPPAIGPLGHQWQKPGRAATSRIDVFIFEEEDESPFVGLLQVEVA
jgi:hypothetical protein